MKCLCGYECDEISITEGARDEQFVRIFDRMPEQGEGYVFETVRFTALGEHVQLYACPKCGTVRMER